MGVKADPGCEAGWAGNKLKYKPEGRHSWEEYPYQIIQCGKTRPKSGQHLLVAAHKNRTWMKETLAFACLAPGLAGKSIYPVVGTLLYPY